MVAPTRSGDFWCAFSRRRSNEGALFWAALADSAGAGKIRYASAMIGQAHLKRLWLTSLARRCRKPGAQRATSALLSLFYPLRPYAASLNTTACRRVCATTR
jgi:hypothetical protein